MRTNPPHPVRLAWFQEGPPEWVVERTHRPDQTGSGTVVSKERELLMKSCLMFEQEHQGLFETNLTSWPCRGRRWTS